MQYDSELLSYFENSSSDSAIFTQNGDNKFIPDNGYEPEEAISTQDLDNSIYPYDFNFNCTNCSFNINQLGVLIVPNPDEIRYPWISNQHFYPNILTYAVTLLIGLFGNVVVIAIMTGDRKSRNTTNVFLVSLSVADLLMLSICVPLEMLRLFVVLLNYGGAACKMGHYFMMLSFTASVLNLTAVSLERFIVIVFPMRSRSLCTMSNCRRSVLLVWLIALVLAGPLISVVEEESIIYTNPSRTERVVAHYCKDVDSLVFPTYRLIVLFGIPAVLMTVFYTAVIRVLWKSAKNIRALTNSPRNPTVTQEYVHHGPVQETYCMTVHASPRYGGRLAGTTTTDLSNGRIPLDPSDEYEYNLSPVHQYNYRSKCRLLSSPMRRRPKEKTEDVRKTRKQVIKMLIVVVLLFVLCWGPSIVIEMLIGLGKQEFTQEFYVFKLIASFLPFIHCCINPMIYCFMSKNFRKSMSRVLSGPCGKSTCCTRETLSRVSRHTTVRMSSTSFIHEATTGNSDLETISAI